MKLLLHWSKEEIKELVPVTKICSEGFSCKPNGLWFGVEDNGDGWKSWCEAERLDWLGGFCYRVSFRDGANILHISNTEEFDSFNQKYGTPKDRMPSYLRTLSVVNTLIDWDRVAKDYQGIVISPYLWSKRMDMDCFWYYGWDCASGVVWDMTAVSIEPYLEEV